MGDISQECASAFAVGFFTACVFFFFGWYVSSFGGWRK